MERRCHLDAVGRKPSQQTASSIPHVIATPPSSEGLTLLLLGPRAWVTSILSSNLRVSFVS